MVASNELKFSLLPAMELNSTLSPSSLYVILLLLSWGLAIIPGLTWRGKNVGVPVKDYILQSGLFAICALGLIGHAAELWRSAAPGGSLS